MVAADLALKSAELASLELAIDEAARKKKNEHEARFSIRNDIPADRGCAGDRDAHGGKGQGRTKHEEIEDEPKSPMCRPVRH